MGYRPKSAAESTSSNEEATPAPKVSYSMKMERKQTGRADLTYEIQSFTNKGYDGMNDDTYSTGSVEDEKARAKVN